MSFVINRAEIFNYKTNYEAANASHLTQPSPKQNRTFSGGGEKEGRSGRERARAGEAAQKMTS